jgi:outer membrane immunogenic protein
LKNVLLSAIALSACLAVSSAAKAADVYADQGFDWSGLYLGLQGGYGFGETSWYEDIPGGGETQDGNLEGVAGGLTLGFNWQMDSLVFGLETDISLSDINADSEESGSFGCAPSNQECTTDLEWFGTARGRLGFAMGHTLPFITGGVAFGDAKGTTDVTNGDDTLVGWTAGAGVEHAFTDNLSVKLEGLYVDLGELELPEDCGTDCATTVDFAIVRLGVNYRF